MACLSIYFLISALLCLGYSYIFSKASNRTEHSLSTHLLCIFFLWPFVISYIGYNFVKEQYEI